MTKIKKYYIIIFSILLFFFSGSFALAVEISLSAKTQEMAVGQQFQLDMSLNTDNKEINAIEGKIIFPSDILELKEIRIANSIINFWVAPVRNCISNGVEKPDEICFAGITPGGYKGEKGLLFSLIFLPKKEGLGVIDIQEAKTLLNDGKGTEASLSISPYQFTTSQVVSSAPSVPQVSPIIDKEPPESFVPEIAQNPAIFNGKWFIVFATQDKGSGVDHYEIKESRQKILIFFSRWKVAESPYILRDQELRSYLFVKAFDKAGNIRIKEIAPQNPLKWYENYENWSIVVLGFIIAYTIKNFLWRRYLKK